MYLSKIKNLVQAELTIVDKKAAAECVDYILGHDKEIEDYYNQAAEHGITKKNWETKWYFNHVYAHALKAIGDTPDPDEFEE
jgi:hypothetical protein